MNGLTAHNDIRSQNINTKTVRNRHSGSTENLDSVAVLVSCSSWSVDTKIPLFLGRDFHIYGSTFSRQSNDSLRTPRRTIDWCHW